MSAKESVEPKVDPANIRCQLDWLIVVVAAVEGIETESVGGELRTRGGLVLAQDPAKKLRATRGRVIAAGKGVVARETGELIPNPIAVGDMVVFGQYDGAEIKIGNEPFRAVRAESIIAVIEQSN